MTDFKDVVQYIKDVTENFVATIIEETRSRLTQRLVINGESVYLFLIKANVTGTDRLKPQVRVFTEKFLEALELANKDRSRAFFFVHYPGSGDTPAKAVLKLTNIDPSDYLISLETEKNIESGRIDIRSLYDFIESKQPSSYTKIKQGEHTASSVTQAAVFNLKNADTPPNLLGYLTFFDNRLSFQSEEIGEVETNLSNRDFHGLNKVYFGAPGTGKSYGITHFIKEKAFPDYKEQQNHPNIYRATLHPDYSYFDFVGQIMPQVQWQEGQSTQQPNIVYSFTAGIFTKALGRAIKRPEEPVFLILEEMSRANVSAVFGDLFQLLDRNVVSGESEYRVKNDLISQYVFDGEEKNIYIPSNLYILGTVNTNDQNVFVMDTAFKRRFEFEYLSANEIVKGLDGNPINDFEFILKEGEKEHSYQWSSLFQVLNRFIVTKEENGGLGLNEDKQLGQFFIKFKAGNDSYNFNQIKGKLIHYLYDDIENTSFSSHSIFSNSISCFSDIYDKLKKRENVFSKEFVELYSMFEK